jgi:hypothetical protein
MSNLDRRATGRVPGRRRRPRRAARVPPTAGAALDRAPHRLGRLAPRRRRAAGAADQRAAAIAWPAPLNVDAAAEPGGQRCAPDQARAVVAYATRADERGFCFFGNPAAHRS